MNTKLERFTLLIGLVVLFASIEFGLGIINPFALLVGALLLSAGATLLWLQFDLPSGHPWLPPLVLSAASLLCTLVLELAFRASFAEWFTFLAAGLGSALCMLVIQRNRARCNLCNRRLRSQALVFRCPRCSLEVCDETCWDFEHRRCALCLEQRVSVLPIKDSWWSRVAGPRSLQGRCQLCLASADQADLRACPKCRRMQCRECWDFNNGECDRCRAPLPELPESLHTVVSQTYGQ